MVPLPDYEKLPLFYRQARKLDTKSTLPWARYPLEKMKGIASDGQGFRYYVEHGEPVMMTMEDLGNEFFAHELQKVNVTRPDSVFQFCERYGLPVSAGYDSIQRLSWYRRRFKFAKTPFIPIANAHDILIEGAAMAASSPLMEAAEGDADAAVCGIAPYLLSELARSSHISDKGVVGAISEAEVIQTIRAMQTAMALLPVIDYASLHSDEWGASMVADYLSERSHMAQNGVTFFLRPFIDDKLLEESRLKSYEVRLATDSAFRDMVDSGEEAGFDTRAAYTASLGEGLIIASNKCMEFLQDSLLSYAAPINAARIAYSRQQYDQNTPPWRRGIDSLSLRNGGGIYPANSEGSLSAAIITQFSFVYDDPSEWRVCSNCGRIFKKYREEKPGHVVQQTRFCKRSCANQFSKKKLTALNTE